MTDSAYGPCGVDMGDLHRTACIKLKCDVARRQYFGFNSDAESTGFQANGTLAAGATGVVVRKTEKPIWVERLVVASEVAEFFDILDVRMGNQPQSVTPDNPAPATMFSEVAVDAWVVFDCMVTAQSASIRVTNRDNEEHQFRAGFFVWSSMI